MTETIRVTGAREHNLKNVTVEIPKKQLTVVTGVSGSGKSSLVFDTIAAESQRQLNETFTTFVRNRLPKYGQPDVDAIENLSTAIVVDQRPLGGNSRSTVGTSTDIYSLMRLLWSRAGKPFVGYSNAFSFNDPAGMCQRCDGIGVVKTIDLAQLVDPALSLKEGAIRFPGFGVHGWTWRQYAESRVFDLDKPAGEFSAEEWASLLYGADFGELPTFEGVVPRIERIWLPKDVTTLRGNVRDAYERVIVQGTCPDCGGARLSKAALSSRIGGRNIAEAAAMEADQLAAFVRTIDEPSSAPVVEALGAQLERLVAIGLGYLTMDRPTLTLSGGESQRVKMVRHLGSSLTDLTYVFDEPSVGLHPYDVEQLNELLKSLRDKGNTVLVVEHDPDVIAVADHVLDLGPGPGDRGGCVVYEGKPAGLAEADTPTGRHFARATPLRRDPRKPTGWVRVRGATRHNLRDVDVDIPQGVLTVVTGVAGSGKSTLVHGYLPDAHLVSQRAIRGSRRSSPATYTGVLDVIRARFAEANGVSAQLFSPNSSGACARCRGLGVIYTDLAFMDTMVTTCEQCGGRRFTDEVLAYTYQGMTIADVLDLPAAKALEVFDRPELRRLVVVGLGYLPLGQPLTTLSGGERQRLKLADELDARDRMYVFDEPTTGLHMADVEGLVALFERLLENGNSVVVIEHNLDVISQADWIVDLGPGAGRHGGRVLFAGQPHDLLGTNGSRTAEHLRRYLG